MSHSALLYFYVICIGKYMNSIFIEYITEIKIAMIILQLTTWRLYFEELQREGIFSIDVSRRIYFGYILVYFGIFWLYFGYILRSSSEKVYFAIAGSRLRSSEAPIHFSSSLCANSPILTAFQHFKTVS